MSPPSDLSTRLDKPGIGEALHALAAEIYPICRSITGQGVRDTLAKLSAHADIAVHETPTGTPVYDWTAPREWNIRDAYVKDASGRRAIDFRAHNLHVLNYSTPISARMNLAELKPHLFTLPDQPDLIPYRTSYYAERWGFCLSHNAMLALEEGEYDVVIDSSLTDGSLTYGEFVHQGESSDELLISTHICHPSLANDNCSGLALATLLAAALKGVKTRYTYRFVFVPGTIGSLTWLSRNEEILPRIKHGLVLAGVGDGGGPTYKKSRGGDAAIDRIMQRVLRQQGGDANIIDFFPYGYDERQYCSPGFDLPVGLYERGQFATFPEYHTSADNLDFIKPRFLEASWNVVTAAIVALEQDQYWLNTSPKGEPQLGKRGLYSNLGGDKDAYARNMAMLWVLNLSDGAHSVTDIAERSKIAAEHVEAAAAALAKAGLLKRV